MKRKFLANILLVVLFVLSMVLTACNSNDEPADSTSEESADPASEETKEKLRFAWINPMIGYPLYTMQDDGAKMAAEDLGVELTILGTSAAVPEQYVQQIETAIVEKYDGIVVCPFSPEAMIPALQRAKDAGIPVIFTIADTPSNPELRNTLIGLNLEEFGATQADAIAQATGEKGNIVWMQTSFEGIQNDFRAGFEKRLADYPDLKLAVSDFDQADTLVAVQKFQDIFTANPDVNAVVSCSVTAGPAAAKVAGEMNRDVAILAIDDIPETLDQIRSGELWGTVAQNYIGMGYESIRLLNEIANGNSVPESIDCPLVLVTEENVDTYTEEFSKNKGIPW